MDVRLAGVLVFPSMLSPIPSGMLVAIEGIDGAGKTTIASSLAIMCERRHIPHVLSKEPTAGFYGQKLRDSAVTGRMSLEDELDLFIKDRNDHVETRIGPALKAGKAVILDRYYFSTAAYQGAWGVSPEHIIAVNEAFAPRPTLLLILDLPAREGLSRIRARGDKPNMFEREEMLDKSREIFLSMRYPYARFIDARKPLDVVRKEAAEHFLSFLAEELKKTGMPQVEADQILNCSSATSIHTA